MAMNMTSSSHIDSELIEWSCCSLGFSRDTAAMGGKRTKDARGSAAAKAAPKKVSKKQLKQPAPKKIAKKRLTQPAPKNVPNKRPAAQQSALQLVLQELLMPARASAAVAPQVTRVPPAMRENLTMGSVFTGFGTDHWMAQSWKDLQQWWLSNSWWCEKDPCCQKFLRSNLSGCASFTDVSSKEFESASRVDILSAGFPCQPFSVAGLGQALKDPRGVLVLHCIRYIQKVLPHICIFENVAGLYTRHRKVLDQLLALLKEIREINTGERAYDVFHTVLDSKDHGVPQHRERLYIVLVRRLGRSSGVLRWPQAVPTPRVETCLDSGRRRLKSLGDFPLHLTSGVCRKNLLEALEKVRQKAVASGTTPMSYTPIVDTGGSRLNMNFSYSPTITRSRGGSRSFWSLAHGARLSVTELLRLQGLPVDVDMCVSDTSMGRMCGNAFTGPVYAKILVAALQSFFRLT